MNDYIADYINAGVFLASGLPIVGGMFSTIDNARYYSDYMNNRGLAWHDVKYPARLNAGGYGSTLSFVSKNIEKLYR